MLRRSRRGSLVLPALLLFGACRSATPPRSAGRSFSPSHDTGPSASSPLEARTPTVPRAQAPASEPGNAANPSSAGSSQRAALPDFGSPGWTRVASNSGAHLVCWRPLGDDSVPRNQDFSLEAWVFAGGAAQPGQDLVVSAWMPDHGHGMLHVPRTRDHGDGSYLVEGMLLHMRGHWELQFNLIQGADSDLAQCGLEVK